MKFAVPVNTVGEIPTLAASGAGELYCGLLEESWGRCYGLHDSISRRQGRANFEKREELEEAVETARGCGLPVFLTLNANYIFEQENYLLELAHFWQDIGGRGVIVRDIGFMHALKRELPGLALTASLLVPTINRKCVDMLYELGVSRIVLPRFLDLSEMSHIASYGNKKYGMGFEAMVIGDKCLMADAWCRSVHMPSEAAGHLCLSYHRPEQDPCAACSMSFFDKAGIETGKIGGRGTSLDERIKQLEFLVNVRETKPDADTIENKYVRTFSHTCNCYYQAHSDVKINIPVPSDPERAEPALESGSSGHWSCPAALSEIADKLRKGDAIGQIIIPPVTEYMTSVFSEILRLIKDQKDIKLVLNDYGSLYECCRLKKCGQLNCRVAAGLLLSGEETDPLLKNKKEPSVLHHWHILCELGVDIIELSEAYSNRTRNITGESPETSEIKKEFRIGKTDAENGNNIVIETAGNPAILAVKPCRGDCMACKEKTVIRGNTRVLQDRNLFYIRENTKF